MKFAVIFQLQGHTNELHALQSMKKTFLKSILNIFDFFKHNEVYINY